MIKCIICNNTCGKVDFGYDFIIEKGFFSKKMIKICYDCQRILNEKYGIENRKSEIYGNTYAKLVDDIDDFKNLDKLRQSVKEINKQREEKEKEYREEKEKEQREKREKGRTRAKKARKIKKERTEALKKSIINLLKEKVVKMPASDIDAHLKHQNVDEIKEVCEKMYIAGEISRTGNYRYFILTEEKKKPKTKKTSAPKSEEVDIEKELEKYKRMLDKDLITEEEYEAKKKEFLGSPASPKSVAKSTEKIVSKPKSKKVSLESVKKDEIEESKTEKSSADSSDDPIESFRSFISSSFKNIKNPKGKPYGICPIGSGIELDFYVKKICVAVYLYSNGKVNAESLIKKINDSGITGKVLNDKYTLEPMSGKRNPEVVRIDINIMYEGRELNSKEMRDEVKDIYGQMLFLCKNLV